MKTFSLILILTFVCKFIKPNIIFNINSNNCSSFIIFNFLTNKIMLIAYRYNKIVKVEFNQFWIPRLFIT